MSRRLSLVAVLAACAALAAAPPAANAVSYSKAKRIAVRTLEPESYSDPVVLFGLSRPVSSRSRVFEAAKVPHQNLKRIGRRSYLFWLDKQPGALFEHPSTLLLVNASSGRVVRRQNYRWWPLVDGRRPAFVASVRNYSSRRYVVYEADRARHNAKQTPAQAASIATDGPLQNTCMVLVDDQRDPLLKGSVSAYRGLSGKLGIPLREVTSGLALDNALTDLQKGGCQSVLLSIVAHGWDAQTSPSYPRVTLFEPANRGADGIYRPEQTNLDGPYVANILDDHKGLKYSVTVTSCFGDRWRQYLDNDKRLTGRLRVITASSGDMEPSWGIRFPEGPFIPQSPPVFFDQGFIPAVEQQYTPLPGGGVSGPPIEEAIANGFPGGYYSAAGRVILSSTPHISDHVEGTISIAFGVSGAFADDVQDEDRPWGTGKVVATSSDGDPPKTLLNGRVANDGGEFGPYHPGATVTLTPTADRGSHFTGWDGQCQGAGETCVLQNLFGSGKISAAAHFAVTSYVVKVVSDNKGLVTAGSGPLQCGYQLNRSYDYCSERFHASRSDDDLVLLKARADDGGGEHHFVSFEGCDSVVTQASDNRFATCYMNLNSDRTVKATFADGR